MLRRWKIAIVAVAIPMLAVGGMFALHLASKTLAGPEIDRAQQVLPTSLGDFGSTTTLEILPIIEKEALNDSYRSEHGVSYLIRTDSTRLLLDTGMNAQNRTPSPAEANMKQLGLGLADFDTVVISHWHPDHTGGLNWWLKRTFSLGTTQPDLAGKQAFVPTDMSYPGLTPVVSAQPIKIAEGVALLGTIPFREVIDIPGVPVRNTEQAVAVNVRGKGIVIITGCGHPTLPVIIAHAQAAFDQPVIGIVGGLHLIGASAETIAADIQLLTALHPAVVGLSPHDSGPDALLSFRTAFPDAYQDVQVGRTIRLP